MDTNIYTLIGEATAYDKKQMLEVKRPKSWLKSVSAFANGEGGTLIFGISDDDQIVGIADAKGDADKISEEIKTKLDPVLMERRGSGMKKIIDSYKRFEGLHNFHVPEFQSNASEFHVILWNLNYGSNAVLDEKEFLKVDIGTEKEFLKEDNKFRKEFLKAQRIIYKLISSNPGITIVEMAANIGVSDRQVRKYLKRMTDMKFIVREGGRKNGMWRIIDGDYEDFFERI